MADSISRCGSSSARPSPRSARRCATPKRCCSSTIASPSRWNSTASWISACVPTTSWAAPLATACCAPRLAAAVRRPTSHATLTSSGASHCAILRKCCSARISVGAISATWKPHSIARAAASAAITVLPLPTSPCTRRCIGRAPARSRSTSIQTRSCAAVSLNGSASRSFVVSSPEPRSGCGAPLLARVARRAQRDLLRQQFVELQALPGRIGALGQRVRVGIGRRVMQAPDRRLQRGQAELAEQPRGQHLDDVDVAQRAVDALAQPALRHALGRRVDRRQRRRQRSVLHERAHARVDHLRAGQAAAHAAERAHAPSGLELLQLRRVEVQEAQHQFAAVVAHGDAQLATAAVDDVGREHLGLDLRLGAGHEVGDRRHVRFVLVAQRQVQDEVPVARQAGARELRRDGVARRRRAQSLGGGASCGPVSASWRRA